NLNVMDVWNQASKLTLPETSPEAPSITAFNYRLWIAWKGDGNDNLNMASLNPNPDPTQQGKLSYDSSQKKVFNETSPKSPALAVSPIGYGNKLWLGWKGDGNDWLNVMDISDPKNPVGKIVTDEWGINLETSPEAPSLTTFNNSLWIAWKGDGN